MAGIISRIVGYFAPAATAAKPAPEPEPLPSHEDSSNDKPESKSPEISDDQTDTNTTGVQDATNESECWNDCGEYERESFRDEAARRQYLSL